MFVLHSCLGFDHFLALDRVGLGGGLALLWTFAIDVSILSFFVGHNDMCVKIWGAQT